MRAIMAWVIKNPKNTAYLTRNGAYMQQIELAIRFTSKEEAEAVAWAGEIVTPITITVVYQECH